MVAWVLMNWEATVLLFFFPVRAPVLLIIGVAMPLLSAVRGAWQPALHVLAAMAVGSFLMNKSFSPRRGWLLLRAWWIEKQLKRRARRFRVVPPPDDARKGPDRYVH